MSYSINFDDVLSWITDRAPFGRVVRYLTTHLHDHELFRGVFAREEEFAAAKAWDLSNVSPEGLQVLRQSLRQMAAEMHEVLADVPHEHRPPYEREISGLRRIVDARIERIRRHGTLDPPWPAIVFGHGIYCEAPDASLATVMDYLRTHQSEHPDLRLIFTDHPILSEGKAKAFWHVTPDGLQVIRRLVDRIESELPTLADARGLDRVDFKTRLDSLKAVIEERLADLQNASH